MKYTDEQIKNILTIYDSVEEMENTYTKREAEEYLKNTDYIIIKMQEYQITGQQLDNDYTEILQKREEARNIIRGLKST